MIPSHFCLLVIFPNWFNSINKTEKPFSIQGCTILTTLPSVLKGGRGSRDSWGTIAYSCFKYRKDVDRSTIQLAKDHSTYLSIKFLLHKQLENPCMYY